MYTYHPNLQNKSHVEIFKDASEGGIYSKSGFLLKISSTLSWKK